MSSMRDFARKAVSSNRVLRFLALAAKMFYQELGNRLQTRPQKDTRLTKNEKAILRNLRRRGFHVMEGYYSPAQCKSIRDEIDRLMLEYHDKVWIDPVGADSRLFGADRVSPLIKPFFRDQFLTRIIYEYERCSSMEGCTLAGRLTYQPANIGSGQGWHRDSVHRWQTKAILYLNDVDASLGPFQYLKGSHRPFAMLRDIMRGRLGFHQTRFEDIEVDALNALAPQRLTTFTAGAGTLLLVDTRGIHRGMPMENPNGVRYSLTNYLWPDEIPAHIAAMVVG